MRTLILTLSLSIIACFPIIGQPLAIQFDELKSHGLKIEELEKRYQSGVNVDSTKAVFKTEAEQDTFYKAYVKLLRDLGKHLVNNQFHWAKPFRSFNRIYFAKTGTIDYFLFNFLGEADAKPSEQDQATFQRLLQEFIKGYQIQIQADVDFAQCSPTTFMPPAKK